MARFMLLATIVSLSAGKPGVAHAHAAISEPGAYAFYRPNGNVLRAAPQSFGANDIANAMTSAPIVGMTSQRHKR